MKEKHLDFVRMVLDHQLLDANYVECGKVEDLELTGGAGKLEVTALITGQGAAVRQLPHWWRAVVRKLFGARETRIPWEQVLFITSQIKLKSKAAHLGLDEEDSRAAEWLKKLPGAE